jgi:predicted aspartyl protease
MGKCSGRKAFRVSNGGSNRWRLPVALLMAISAGSPLVAVEPVSLSRPSKVGPLERVLGTQRHASFPYREALGRAVVVPVYLNGRGPFDLVLDTATRFTTLDLDLAEELGLQGLGTVPVVTLAGSRSAIRARIARLTLGEVELAGVEILCAEVPVLRSADRRIRGFLGQTALSRISFGLDHRARRVFFDRPRRADAIIPLVEREGRPMVSVAIKGSSAALSLVLDSGLEAPVLFEKAGARLPVVRVPGFFDAVTNSGIARLGAARLEGRIGSLALPAVLAAVQHDAAAGGREEDGLLPTRSFRVLYFDRSNGTLLLAR